MTETNQLDAVREHFIAVSPKGWGIAAVVAEPTRAGIGGVAVAENYRVGTGPASHGMDKRQSFIFEQKPSVPDKKKDSRSSRSPIGLAGGGVYVTTVLVHTQKQRAAFSRHTMSTDRHGWAALTLVQQESRL